MTTIVAVRKNGDAAIAADTMSTWGSVRESALYVVNHDKVLRVGESYLAISGPTSVKAVATKYFGSLRRVPRLESVESILSTWLEFHRALKETYFLVGTDEGDVAFESSHIDALVANPHGVFGIAAHRAVQEFSRFYAYGNGWQLALGAMYVAYADNALSAEDVARIGVRAAAEFDDSTAEPVTSHRVRLRLSKPRGRRPTRPH